MENIRPKKIQNNVIDNYYERRDNNLNPLNPILINRRNNNINLNEISEYSELNSVNQNYENISKAIFTNDRHMIYENDGNQWYLDNKISNS